VRTDVCRVLLERADAIVSDSVAIFPYSGPQPLETDYCERLGRRLLQLLSTEVQRAERFSFPLALMVFDVDKLSEINRRHGYGVGDRVLERLGILIRKFFRQDDWVFRHGEDSIAVLLCQISADDAFFLASRVVAMVEQRLGFRDHNNDDRVSVTVSAATITGQGSVGEPFDAERLLLEADTSLKRAKSMGRNGVERSAIAPTSLSVQSAAHYLQCSPSVVQKLIAEGKLKTTGAGHTLRIEKLAIEDYRSANG
jgi:diguanylate cyclase (GGDEF)-like protein/excisionase family DNA binding protein